MTLLMVDWWSPPPSQSDYTASGDNFAQKSREEYEQAMLAAVAATEFASARRVILRADNLLASTLVLPESLDFIFIDGDHSYTGTLAAIESWWPKLKPNGLMCGHDFGRTDSRLGVDQAVGEWSRHCGCLVALWSDFVWAIWKPSGERGPHGLS
jgi:hypothetical protein